LGHGSDTGPAVRPQPGCIPAVPKVPETLEAHSEVLIRRRRTTQWHRYLRTRSLGGARWSRLLQPATALLLMLGITGVAIGISRWAMQVPWGAYTPFAVVAGLLLAPRYLAAVDIFLLVVMGYSGLTQAGDKPAFLGAYVVLVTIMVLMFWVAASRARLGVQGTLGESMLVDLRDRLRTQGELPDLPPEWGAELSVLSAYGDSFSGDFVVTSRSGDTFEVVLVDVSGKGVAAGTRSLLLSGAFGGLLGAMSVDRFLPAANSYLLRQHWDEGFATAAHASINLRTGDFSIGSEILETEEGPVLGVTERLGFPRTRGVLGRGDALLLYTDGVIEVRNRDLHDGIDRMLGTAEQMITQGFEGMVHKLCASARAGESDDRAAVLVWRR
jgi:stage II sporulation SpoE-like protein